ncbi:MAG: tape measure protein [Clostridia bacterium]|nr:tape measure protein [Clostridia bacterium]
MPTVKTALVLQDKMSSVMRSMTKAIGTMITGLEGVETAGGKAFDPNMTRQMRIAVGEANAKLSEMENEYKRASLGQQDLNNHMRQGSAIAGGLASKVKGFLAAYASMQGVKMMVKLSDEITQTGARLNLMNDGLQTTGELMNMVYQAANRSRGSFQDMADVVAKLGNNARGAFKGSAEVVKFAEAVQKQFVVSGTSAQEASNAMLQLTQALGSGVLRGDELRSVMEQAPGLVNLIAKEMGVEANQIRDIAAEGKITADIVKNAVLNNVGDINAAFDKIPMTWQGIWTNMKNDAIVAVKPLLDAINKLANNPHIQAAANGVMVAVSMIANGLAWVIEKAQAVYSFFADNWSSIAPIVLGVAAAVGIYQIATHASSMVTMINTGVVKLCTLAIKAHGVALTIVHSKILLIMLIIVAVIAVISTLIMALGKASGQAKTTFGTFCAGISVVGAWFKNVFGIVVPAFLKAVLAAASTVAHNMQIAFQNSIARIKSFFYGLLSTVMSVIASIANALNKLPFIKFDASGITGAADKYAAKAAAAADSVQNYASVSDAFKNAYDKAGGNTAFAEGWKEDAAAKGAAWGDEKAKAIKDKIGSFKDNLLNGQYTGADPATGYGVLGNIADNTGKTADTTGSIAKSLDTTNEELSWIRDVAERDVINRFTTAEIKIDMTGMTNEIKNDVDVDGLFNRFTNDVRIALQTAAAGVH